MVRRVAVLCAVLLIGVPLFSSAQTVEELQARINTLLQQIQELQARIAQPAGSATTTTASSSGACPVFSRTLGIGSRGEDVTQLQLFLRTRGYFNEDATGYFGPITETALQRLQAAQNIVSSGDAQTTGYGSLGPRTRASIAMLCGSAPTGTSATAAVAPSHQAQCPAIASATAPSASCAGTWERLTSLGCHVGWRCVLPAGTGNRPPVISGIDGPTALAVGAFGTWRINAADPEHGALSYSVTWGDEGAEEILRALAGLSATFTQSPTITHSYARAGTYTIQVRVRDSAGNIATAALPVSVSADGTTASGDVSTYASSLIPPTTPAAAASCITPWGTQVVRHLDSAAWQPFFTDGLYFSATSTPVMRCSNGSWLRCDEAEANCQAYVAPTSTPSSSGGALQSYSGTIGSRCTREGEIREVSVPPGTQLCQWLNCTTTTQTQTVKLRCTNTFWSDYQTF